MSKFKVGDKVKVNQDYSKFEGHVGTVKRVVNEDTYTVSLFGDSLEERGFFERELEFAGVDNKEKLIVLAETLNNARLQANEIEIYVIESQHGVYGQIMHALTDTLEQILEAENEDENNAWNAGRVYSSVLDGNSVREALAWWEGQK